MIDIENLRVNFENKALNSGRLVIIPHKLADFDAIGSAIGLSLAAKKLKKDSIIVVDDKAYELDRGVHAIINEAKKEFQIKTKCKYLNDRRDDDFYVLTDVNKHYLISLGEELKDGENIMIIDHHEEDDNTVVSDDKYIDTKSSSASEIVTKMLLKMKIQIPPNIANYLLAGIYLDTNKMQKNVTQSTLETASKLLGQGADLNHVMDYFQEDFDSDRRVQDLINKNRMIVYKIGMIVADPDEEYTTKELARAADYSLTFGPDASFAIGRISDDTVAVSARSKEKVDIGKLMNFISNGKGGGTPFSAAATIKREDTEEIGKRLEKLLRPQFYLEKE